MKHGIGSMEAVASQLLWDIIEIGPLGWKQITRLTPWQTFEKVINRRETVAMAGAPAYVWGILEEDNDEYDTGKADFFGQPIIERSSEVMCSIDRGYYQQGLWLSDGRSGSRRNVRYNVVADECDNMGSMERFFTNYVDGVFRDEMLFDVLLREGIQINQPFLFRVVADWHTDYWGESDLSWGQELLYAEPTEMTEEWLTWLLQEAEQRELSVAARQQRDANRQARWDAEKLNDELLAARTKTKLQLPGTRNHADAVAKRTKTWRSPL